MSSTVSAGANDLVPKGPSIVELTRAADTDFDSIYEWTYQTFGARQAEQYAQALHAAINALTENAAPSGAKARNDLGPGVYTLHVARRRARHLLVYKRTGENEILILRILHDSMDIARHLPSNDE